MSNSEHITQRNFEDTLEYPIYNYADTDASCINTPSGLSVSINQADHNVSIYDQKKDVVYYSVHFRRSLCGAPTTGNLPVDTIEIKMAWKVLNNAEDLKKYVNIKRDLLITTSEDSAPPVKKSNVTLGLVGFHLVQSTPNHPEMIWATFEHKDNVPDCKPATPYQHYSFMSNSCWKQLMDGHITDPTCKFNQAQEQSVLRADATEICRVYPDASDIKNPLYYQNSQGVKYNPNKYDQNVDAINQLNAITTSGQYYAADPVLKNYFIVGGLWESDISQPSSVMDNQRGSLELANTLMETTIQGGNIPDSPTKNCFHCHAYTPGETATSGLSHIFSALQPPAKGIKDVIRRHDFGK